MPSAPSCLKLAGVLGFPVSQGSIMMTLPPGVVMRMAAWPSQSTSVLPAAICPGAVGLGASAPVPERVDAQPASPATTAAQRSVRSLFMVVLAWMCDSGE
ncbi:hypothetical protein D3C86_1665740 [compost metagenome]